MLPRNTAGRESHDSMAEVIRTQTPSTSDTEDEETKEDSENEVQSLKALTTALASECHSDDSCIMELHMFSHHLSCLYEQLPQKCSCHRLHEFHTHGLFQHCSTVVAGKPRCIPLYTSIPSRAHAPGNRCNGVDKRSAQFLQTECKCRWVNMLQ